MYTLIIKRVNEASYMIGTLMNHGCTCVLKEKGGSKKIPVHPEQYVYVQVSNAWIPAILKYSGERQNWYFEYLPKLPVNGCRVMTK